MCCQAPHVLPYRPEPGVAANWVATAAAVEPSVVAVQVTTSSGGDEGSGVIL